MTVVPTHNTVVQHTPPAAPYEQVWDLAADKHAPLTDQKIVKKAHATHVCFNATSPILLAADSAGGVVSLKLSPNLRKLTPIPQPPVRKVRRGKREGRKRIRRAIE